MQTGQPDVLEEIKLLVEDNKDLKEKIQRISDENSKLVRKVLYYELVLHSLKIIDQRQNELRKEIESLQELKDVTYKISLEQPFEGEEEPDKEQKEMEEWENDDFTCSCPFCTFS